MKKYLTFISLIGILTLSACSETCLDQFKNFEIRPMTLDELVDKVENEYRNKPRIENFYYTDSIDNWADTTIDENGVGQTVYKTLKAVEKLSNCDTYIIEEKGFASLDRNNIDSGSYSITSGIHASNNYTHFVIFQDYKKSNDLNFYSTFPEGKFYVEFDYVPASGEFVDIPGMFDQTLWTCAADALCSFNSDNFTFKVNPNNEKEEFYIGTNNESGKDYALNDQYYIYINDGKIVNQKQIIDETYKNDDGTKEISKGTAYYEYFESDTAFDFPTNFEGYTKLQKEQAYEHLFFYQAYGPMLEPCE